MLRYKISYAFNSVHGGRCIGNIEIKVNFEVVTATDFRYIRELIEADLVERGEWKQPEPEVLSVTLLGSTGDDSRMRLAPAGIKQPWHQRSGSGVTTVHLNKPSLDRVQARPAPRLVALDGGRRVDRTKQYLCLVGPDSSVENQPESDRRYPKFRVEQRRAAKSGDVVGQRRPKPRLVTNDGILVEK